MIAVGSESLDAIKQVLAEPVPREYSAEFSELLTLVRLADAVDDDTVVEQVKRFASNETEIYRRRGVPPDRAQEIATEARRVLSRRLVVP